MFRLIIAVLFLMSVPMYFRSSEWTNLGIGGGGAQFTPAISPIDHNLMLVSCDMSGVYRTTDGGASWQMLDWRQINSGVICYPVFHPADVNTVYAYGQGKTGNALLISKDKGITWNNLVPSPLWGASGIIAIYIDRGNPNLMFVGTAKNAYRSTNGGADWNTCDTISGSVLGFHADQSSPSGNRVCFAATSSGGVYRSDDNGSTWTQKNSGLPAAGVLSFAGGSTSNSICIYCVSSSNNDVYKSTDKGGNWTSAMGTGLDNSYEYIRVVAADNNPDVIYINNKKNVEIYRSSDKGGNWKEILFSSIKKGNAVVGWLEYAWSWGLYIGWGGPLVLGFNIDPADSNRVMGTNNGETMLTTDGGTTWKQLYTKYADTGAPAKEKKWSSIGMEVTTTWNYYIDPSGKNRHYIAYTDTGFARSEDEGKSWIYSREGSPWGNFYEIAFDADKPGTIYAAAAGQHDIPHWMQISKSGAGGVVKSTDYGATWTPVYKGASATSIIRDPSDKALYVVCYGDGVYKSTDSGKSWIRKSAGLEVNNNKHVYSIKQHKDGTLFCLITANKVSGKFPDGGGLFRSNDKGETWTNISAKAAGDGPLYYPMEFDIHPTDSKCLYIGARNATGWEAQGGVYKTADGGNSWTKLPMPIKNPGVFAPIVEPQNPSTVYFTTEDAGIYVSNDSGSSWSEVTGIPAKTSHRITFDYKGKAMYVTTFGGGVWKRSLPK